MNKKALSIIMACTLSIGVMTGCTQGGNTSKNNTTQNIPNSNNSKENQDLQNKVENNSVTEQIFDTKEEAILSKSYVDLTDDEKIMFDKIKEKYDLLKDDVKVKYKDNIERLTKEKDEFMKKK